MMGKGGCMYVNAGDREDCVKELCGEIVYISKGVAKLRRRDLRQWK